MKKNLIGMILLFSAVLLLSTGCRNDDKSGKGNGGASKVKTRIDKLIKADVPVDCATKLPPLAVRQAEELKDRTGAMATLDKAVTSCEKIEDAKTKSEAYAIIAENYAKLGEKSHAKRSLRKAVEALGDLEKDTRPETKIALQVNIARAQGTLGEKEDADQTLKDAVAGVDAITSSVLKVSSLCSIGECYGALKMETGMNEIVAKIHELSETAESIKTKSDNMAMIAAIQFKAGFEAAGKTSFEEAVKFADEIEGAGVKAMTYCDLAAVALAATLKSEAEDLVKKAKKIAIDEKDNALREEARQRVSDLEKKVK